MRGARTLLAALVLVACGSPQVEDRYFDKNYDKLTQSPKHYAAFQLRYVRDSLKRRASLDLDALFKRIR